MTDLRLIKLADVLVNYSTKVKTGDWVHISAGWQALPLVREVQSRVLQAGGYPSVNLGSQDLGTAFLAEAAEAQLNWISPLEMHMIENVDAWIVIDAPENTRSNTGIDPARQQTRSKARRKWSEIYLGRSAAGELHWVMTSFPCQALAQDAEMCLTEIDDFVFKSTFVDQDDPVALWQGVHDEQERLIKWLAGKKAVSIRGAQVDLKMSIEGRTFINSAGDVNMPSGEIFTSPVEDSVEGWVQFSYPAVYQSVVVEGVRLEFEGGRVVKASAEKNEEFLHKMLDADEGARRLGELGIGTNTGITRFTRNILYDEKIGGSFHLAIGKGFAEAGGVNQSAIHWDLITDARQDTEMRADGEVFYKDGKFVV